MPFSCCRSVPITLWRRGYKTVGTMARPGWPLSIHNVGQGSADDILAA